MKVTLITFLQLQLLLFIVMMDFGVTATEEEEAMLNKEALDEKRDSELEAFYVESKLSTSFIKKVPGKFYEIYNTSDGTAKGMYTNCMYTFLILHRQGDLNSNLHVRTLVYKYKSKYLVNLDKLDEDMIADVKLVRLKIGEALHLYCLNSANLFFEKKEGKKLATELRDEMRKAKTEGNYEKNKILENLKEKNIGLFYLLTLLESDISGKELDEELLKKRTKSDVFRDGISDRRRIIEFYNKTKSVRIPIPETRLRNSKGVINKSSNNKLGLPKYLQDESDELKKKINKISRDKMMLYGGERNVDIERKKYLEAALKRNSGIKTFDKSEDKMVRCDCSDTDNCFCSLLDSYGNILGHPVSLKLEEKLFNSHGVIRQRKTDLQSEIKYYKSLIYDKSGNKRKICTPKWEIVLPLSSLSKLQVMSLEQLSGIDYNTYEKGIQRLHPIKEVSYGKNIEFFESVPILNNHLDDTTSKKGRTKKSRY